MKKLLTVAAIISFVACNDSRKNDTVTDIKDSAAADISNGSASREKQISDSTKMLDKMLADSTSTMSPDSLK